MPQTSLGYLEWVSEWHRWPNIIGNPLECKTLCVDFSCTMCWCYKHGTYHSMQLIYFAHHTTQFQYNKDDKQSRISAIYVLHYISISQTGVAARFFLTSCKTSEAVKGKRSKDVHDHFLGIYNNGCLIIQSTQGKQQQVRRYADELPAPVCHCITSILNFLSNMIMLQCSPSVFSLL